MTTENESDAIVVDELERGLRLWAITAPAIAIALTLLDLVMQAKVDVWPIMLRLLATLPFAAIVFFLRLKPRRWIFEASALALSIVLISGCNLVVLKTGGATSPFALVRTAVEVALAVYVTQRERIVVPLYVASLALAIVCIVYGSADGLPRDEIIRGVRFAAMGNLMGLFGSIVNVRRVRRLVEAEQQRREQARRVLLTSERERIASDLHDSVGAQLTGIGLLAERLQKPGLADSEHWREVESLAHVGMQELRDTIWALSSEEHDNATLLANLRHRLELLASAAGCELSWRTEDTEAAPPFHSALSFALLSIVREAVSNALRHGRPSRIDVSIRCDASAVHIVVEDDGTGLGGEIKSGRGMGIMSRRAERLGGASLLEDRAKGGARVTARLPFQRVERQTPLT